jgi:hypothetical protein
MCKKNYKKESREALNIFDKEIKSTKYYRKEERIEHDKLKSVSRNCKH